MISRPTLVGSTLVVVASLVVAGPCDIYASGNTPCVAAHSTTRALYSNYSAPLYQVIRGSDNATADVGPISAGGIANSGTQDAFCEKTTCLISMIYDQSGNSNHLSQAPPGSAGGGPEPGGYDDLVLATGAPATLNGNKVYGVFIQPDSGYRIDNTTGIAKGDDPEGIYAVLDGTHYNQRCCFDYGNAEMDRVDEGAGHMEALYFGEGNGSGYGTGNGTGPWVMADMEDGLFSGENPKTNPADPTVNYRFLTAILKGTHNLWALRGGDASSGELSTFYSGVRPAGYNTLKKSGAIILGIGGDNSNTGQGTFYEGVMTSGYPSDDIENQVQSNIVAARYGTTSLTSGPTIDVGSLVSFRVTTPGYTDRYIAHTNDTINTQVIPSNSSGSIRSSASWTVTAGLGNSACVSFESIDTPGSYIRHDSNFQLMVNSDDGTKLMHEDATFCPQAGLNGQGNTIQSWNYPTRFWRHFNGVLFAASNGGPEYFDSTNSFNNDVSFVVGNSIG